MRILHTSDLHGNWRLPTAFQDFDVWVDSGDFFPNASRGTAIEPAYQNTWLTRDKLAFLKSAKPLVRNLHPGESGWLPPDRRQPPFEGSIVKCLAEWLAGRPALSVPGNHDYTDLAAALRDAGAHAGNLTAGRATLGGTRFAGLREIPWIEGEWAGESRDPELRAAVDRAMSADPEVLVSHSPASGILDLSDGKGGHVGIVPLSQWLTYRPHNVRLVLHGHVHEQPFVTREMDITFSNAAQTARVIEI